MALSKEEKKAAGFWNRFFGTTNYTIGDFRQQVASGKGVKLKHINNR